MASLELSESESLLEDVKRMLKSDFDQFKKNTKLCCFNFPAFYTAPYRLYIQNLAKEFNYKFQINFSHDGKYVQIFKDNCPTYCGDDATFKLTEASQKEIFKYLVAYPLESKERLDLLPGYARHTNLSKPRIQVYKFSIGGFQTVRTSIPPVVTNLKYVKRRMKMPIYPYRDLLLDSINQNQVTLVNGDSSVGKSTQLPQYILENATENNRHCRIIFAHINQISAVNSSKIVAEERSELLGFTVGYQIRLKSVSSFTTNLLYTTTDFFLRCLMGINSKDVFQDVTHVILSDCQEREYNTDLLLFEIKEILNCYPKLKIILMTSSKNVSSYRDYFKNISIIQIKRQYYSIITKSLTEILELINYNSSNIFTTNHQQKLSENRQKLIDNIIVKYFETDDVTTFNEFIYLNEIESISIDVQHSENGLTMLMATIKNNNFDNFRKLLHKNADITLIDSNRRSALDWANLHSRTMCITTLQRKQQFYESGNYPNKKDQIQYNAYKIYRKNNYMEIDHLLLSKLVQYINEKLDQGTILILLPTYADLIKLEYYLNIYVRNLSLTVQLKIFKLFDTMQNRILDDINFHQSTNILRKCILATDLAESCINLNDVVYVIDAGRIEKLISKFNSNGNIRNLQWITQEQSEARKLIAGRYKSGYCFRLYTSTEVENFDSFIIPKLLQLSLDKICLCVKLLSPYTTVTEHFNRLICTPKKSKIDQSVKLLQLIGAFDEQENVTILGIRLIDIPLELQLAKVLIYSILLQCLDPVLTIVSILSYQDPLEISLDSTEAEKIDNLYYRRNLIKNDSLNDLLVLLRIFQQWQDERGALSMDNMTLEKFLLDANLIQISELRAQIVGTVRAAQLIHSQGILSMHYVNLKANKWSMVKACFVAGMYPQICRIQNGIKSMNHDISEVRLNPCSVLNNNTTLNFKYKHTDYESEWLIYQDSIKLNEGYRILKNCTPIHPLIICLFAGHLKKSSDDIKPLIPTATEFNVQSIEDEGNSSNIRICRYIIDNWINFVLQADDSKCILNLRQKFSSFFTEILENCDSPERMRRFRFQYTERLNILDTISKVLQNEDHAWNFSKPERVGERPRALPLSLVHDIHSIIPDVELDMPTLPDPEILPGPSTLFNAENYYMPSCLLNDQYNNTKLSKTMETYENFSNNTSLNVTQINKNYINCSQMSSFQRSSSTENPVNSENLYVSSNAENHGNTFTSVQQYQYNSNMNNQLTNKPTYWNENMLADYQQRQSYLPPRVLQPILGNQTIMNRKYQPNFNINFFLLQCKNINDVYKYFMENIWNDGNTIWDKICIQYMKTIETTKFIVFLWDEELKIFCGYGQLMRYNYGECRLCQFVPSDLKIDNLRSKLLIDNYDVQKFSNSLHFGEIDSETGSILLHYINK